MKLLPLFIQLKENQIRFSINHQEILVTFVKCDYLIDFSISESNFEIIDDKSQILYQLNPIEIKSTFYSSVIELINCMKNKTEPNFNNTYELNYPQISGNNHPLFDLFKNDNKSKILIILKTALLFGKQVDINLSILFGHFEIELISLFNSIWNILILNDNKSAIHLLNYFLNMEQKLPNAFTIMNSSSDTLKKSSNLSIMCKDLGSLKDIFNDILLNINNKNKNPHALTFKQLNHDHEKETSNILQNKLNEWIIELENKMDEINANELKEEYKEEERKINDRKKILLGKLNKAK